MPRQPRMYMANIPCHVVQRGNNRQACFYALSDYLYYIECLQDASDRYRVAVHAYVLMTNHVHLLMTPTDADGISRVMQSIGRRYVQCINFKHRRSGTLWEGRHKASLVDVDNYLLACMRYIELNPVRASMVQSPEEYRWSSYRINAYGKESDLVTGHPTYLALSDDPVRRGAHYRELFIKGIDDEQQTERIRTTIQFSVPLGSERFQRHIESVLGRSTGYAKRGRPRVKEESAAYCKCA